MKSACPCCGAPVEGDWPLVDLASNTVSWGRYNRRTTGRNAEIMTVLLECGRRFVTPDYLTTRLWGGVTENGVPENTRGALAVHMVNLRRVLRPMGFTVDVVYGKGWRLERIVDAKHSRLHKRRPPPAVQADAQ